MTFQERLEIALQLLAASGMKRGNYAPPLYRLLWRSGIPIPPPPFASFLVNFAFSGIWFGALYGVCMWLLVWRPQGTSTTSAVIGAGFAGVLFGLGMAAYWVYKARKHKLPAWSDIKPPAAIFD